MASIIPLADDAGVRRRIPFVNYALILANVAVFAYAFFLAPKGFACFDTEYSLVPGAILSGHPATIQDCGLVQPSPVYITLFTSMFLHANLLHIGGNMLYLWVFGDNVEDRFGHLGYLVFYLVCGLAAAALQIIATVMLAPSELAIPNLGASGAIAGVLGAYILLYPRAKVRSLVFVGIFFTITRLSAYVVIGFFFLLQLLNVYLNYVLSNGGGAGAGGVAYFAHIGGFAAGFVITLLLKPFVRAPAAAQTTPAFPRYNG